MHKWRQPPVCPLTRNCLSLPRGHGGGLDVAWAELPGKRGVNILMMHVTHAAREPEPECECAWI
eukprot:2619510-Rhodomonas_salina.1